MDTNDASSSGGQDGGGRKRLTDFTNQCCQVKKRKMILSRYCVKKRSERKRISVQVRKIQEAMAVMAQKPSLKEALMDSDSVAREIEALEKAWNDAID